VRIPSPSPSPSPEPEPEPAPAPEPERAHLVGSVGLGRVNEVFQTVGRRLGRRLKRVPDGEIGGPRLWIGWQYLLLRASPLLGFDPSGAVYRLSRFPILCLADDLKAGEIEFGELGYAHGARASEASREPPL
jgi:hypothetical protein